MWLLLWPTPPHCEEKTSLFLSGRRPALHGQTWHQEVTDFF